MLEIQIVYLDGIIKRYHQDTVTLGGECNRRNKINIVEIPGLEVPQIPEGDNLIIVDGEHFGTIR